MPTDAADTLAIELLFLGAASAQIPGKITPPRKNRIAQTLEDSY